MRTTVDIPESLLERLKELARRRGVRLSDVVNDALLEWLDRLDRLDVAAETDVDLPVFRGSGPTPGVDLRSNASMFDAADADRTRDD